MTHVLRQVGVSGRLAVADGGVEPGFFSRRQQLVKAWGRGRVGVFNHNLCLPGFHNMKPIFVKILTKCNGRLQAYSPPGVSTSHVEVHRKRESERLFFFFCTVQWNSKCTLSKFQNYLYFFFFAVFFLSYLFFNIVKHTQL